MSVGGRPPADAGDASRDGRPTPPGRPRPRPGSPGAARHLVLVGLPGAGKSVVGRRVARFLDRPFVDLDRAIEEAAGRSVAAIFADEGEPGFRARERDATAALVDAPPSVIAPGGGWVLDPANPAVLRGRAVVAWLRVSPAAAVARMGAGIARRPLLAGDDPLARLVALAERREPLYAAAADVAFETEELAMPVLVRRLAALVTERPRRIPRPGGR